VAYIEQGAVKVIEVIGVSPTSWEDAVRQAVKKSSDSLTGINGVEVVSFTARVDDGEVVSYNATCKIAFAVN
jgi:flavin-binding protein dodecin